MCSRRHLEQVTLAYTEGGERQLGKFERKASAIITILIENMLRLRAKLAVFPGLQSKNALLFKKVFASTIDNIGTVWFLQ